jgi:hypothetical protein
MSAGLRVSEMSYTDGTRNGRCSAGSRRDQWIAFILNYAVALGSRMRKANMRFLMSARFVIIHAVLCSLVYYSCLTPGHCD